MSLINVSLRHGQTLDVARERMEQSVNEAQSRFGALLRQTRWSSDGNRVTLLGPGIEIEMQVDAESLHVSGDMPILGVLLGNKIATGMRAILKKTFPQLPDKGK